jgi:hypothetical protein
LCQGTAVRWHGDLHSENIIVGPDKGFVLIDWRDAFGRLEPPWGDLYYELGKLMHGFVLPDSVIEGGHFTVRSSRTDAGTAITTRYARNDDDAQCLAVLEEYVRKSGLDWWKVGVVCGLIFLRMSPLYTARETVELLWAVGLREVSAAVAGRPARGVAAADPDRSGGVT